MEDDADMRTVFHFGFLGKGRLGRLRPDEGRAGFQYQAWFFR